MLVDLEAGSRYTACLSHPATGRTPVTMARRPKILVFDSGLGGLTVFAEIAAARPDAELVYAADDAGFPYGAWKAAELVPRIVGVVGKLIAEIAPDAVVIACNTAATLVLPDLRAAFPEMPFVGTVPAIKPAAKRSRSKMIAVLATPGTVARDYTRALIESFASDCVVTLVGSTRLAALAEAAMSGIAVADADIAAEIAPCFIERDGTRTDCVVLACTHYPLLLDRLERLAPWPVDWIDPAPAIARRVDAVMIECGQPLASDASEGGESRALFTSGKMPEAALRATLARFHLAVGG